jgi:hypothetical protein
VTFSFSRALLHGVSSNATLHETKIGNVIVKGTVNEFSLWFRRK